jgi:chromosome segregation ATPase
MEEKNKESIMKDPRNMFMDRLQKASTELDSIKTSFSKSMDELGKVQSLLNLDGVENFGRMIQQFEEKLSAAERMRDEATEGARRYGEELEKEKERLVKLWEAYKNQEEELATQEKRATELEGKIQEIDHSKKQLEIDLTARLSTLSKKLEEREHDAHQMEDFRQRALKFDIMRNELEETVHSLRRETNSKDDIIKSLESRVEELRQFEQFADFKKKFEDVSIEFDKEKDRLTKLFRLYEETDTENRQLKQDVKEWQEWFDSNEELFSKLFTSVDHLRKSMAPTTVSTPVNSTETTIESVTEEQSTPDTPEKQRRRLRWKR